MPRSHAVSVLLRTLEVESPGGSAVTHRLCILSFRHERDARTVLALLARGEHVGIGEYSIRSYQKEEPSVVMTDLPMALSLSSVLRVITC